MNTGKVYMGEKGALNQPSPSIWKDCPGPTMAEDGEGYFLHEEFLGIGVAADKGPIGQLAVINTGTSVLTQKVTTTLLGGLLNVATGGTDNNECTIYSQPMAKIVLNSGNKVWFECCFELATLSDAGCFIGLMEAAGMLGTAVAIDPSNSAVAGTVGESQVGFVSVQASSAIATFNAAFKLDAGSLTNMQSDVTNSTAITAQGGTAGNMVAATQRKFGLRFDGKTNMEVFVDGHKITTYPIVSTTFPVNVPLGICLSYLTGTGASRSIVYDWVRCGYQIRQ